MREAEMDDDKLIEDIARLIVGAMDLPPIVERRRREIIDDLRADPTVMWAHPDPDDPLGVIVARTYPEPVRYISINLKGPAA